MIRLTVVNGGGTLSTEAAEPEGGDSGAKRWAYSQLSTLQEIQMDEGENC